MRHLVRCWHHSQPSREAVEWCRVHDQPIRPSKVVACGTHAWAATQAGSLRDWRGFEGEARYHGAPVFGVMHPSEVAKEPKYALVTRMDWARAGRWIKGEWPRAIPVPSRLGACQSAFKAPFVTVDTEYSRETKLLTICGVAWPVGDTVAGVQIEWLSKDTTTAQRVEFREWFHRLAKQVPVVMWNAKADVPVLNQAFGPVTYTALEDAMQAHAVLWSELPHDYGFVASLYGQYPKLKHLADQDHLLYNWGDVIDLVPIWQTLCKEFDPGSERVYRSQSLAMLPITLDREQRGLRVNQEKLAQLAPVYRTAMEDAQRLADAFAGYPCKIGSPGKNGWLARHLRLADYLDLASVDQDTIAEARQKYCPFDADLEGRQGIPFAYALDRIQQGAHPLLEARAMYSSALQVESHYLRPLMGQDRCYPQFNLHTQASGRHSTVDPPLAQFPEPLLDLIVPDHGDVWWGGDYDAQEPRLLMGYSKSKVLHAAFTEGRDIHTEFVCQIYGWTKPPDGFTKGDARRVFAKQARYEIWYLGTGRNALARAVRLGADRDLLEHALVMLRASDPDILDYQHRIRQEVLKTHMSRTWAGRRRVYTAGARSKSEREQMVRCLYNHRNQGGGADIYNLAISEICRTFPQVSWQYGRHDSLWFGMKSAHLTPALMTAMKKVIEQPRDIDGMMVSFPMTYKIMDETGTIWKEDAWNAEAQKC